MLSVLATVVWRCLEPPQETSCNMPTCTVPLPLHLQSSCWHVYLDEWYTLEKVPRLSSCSIGEVTPGMPTRNCRVFAIADRVSRQPSSLERQKIHAHVACARSNTDS